MKRIVRTRIRVIRYCEGEEGGRFRPPLSRYIYARHGTTERHGRDNRPRPFLKAELKSFSTGVQRPLLPRKRKEEKEKRKKTRTVVNATRWPPRLSVNTDANRPAAAPQKFFSASCQPFLLPRTTWCIATHLDRAIFSSSDHVFYLRFAREEDVAPILGSRRERKFD